MTSRPLIVASNRGPVSFEPDEGGEYTPKRGAGGLVSALTGALEMTGGLWVACAMTEGDRAVVAEAEDGGIEVLAEDVKYDVRYLAPPEDVFDRYYNVVSNRILWFLHHFLWDTVRSPKFGTGTREAWKAYEQVNGEFADALARSGEGREPAPVYLVQDYHLSLVPAMLRERKPDALIGHFSHTPFAGPGYLAILPPEMAEALLRGMLGADVLGFQSNRWAELFLLSCRTLPGARVDLRRRRVEVDGRETLVRVYPISVDAANLRQLAVTPEVRAERRKLGRELGDMKLVLRVDRTELSKNILRGFLALEAMLKRHEDWRGKVRMLALLNPSRRGIPEYRAYTRECLAAAERINREIGDEGWQPIEVRVKDDMTGTVAAYSRYDVLMVNPVFDGMNLVTMEGPSVNRRGGVVLLSRNAGAFEILGKHVVPVSPFDVEQQAEALYEALTMSEEERAKRAKGLRRVIAGHALTKWVQRQLDDLERAGERRRD
ncbi:MAG: trehalose-6-phosphate synthase [Actinomycetota bacterium]